MYSDQYPCLKCLCTVIWSDRNISSTSMMQFSLFGSSIQIFAKTTLGIIIMFGQE